MDKVLKVKLIITAFAFILMFCVFSVFYWIRITEIKKDNKKRKKKLKLLGAQYLYIRYKIVKERLYTKKFAFLFAFLDALIISITFIVIELIPVHFILQMLIALVLLLGLLYSFYGILGGILVKRGYQNEL